MTNNYTDETFGYWSLANFVGQGFQVYGDYSFESTLGSLFHFPPDKVHSFTFQDVTVEIPDAMDGKEYAKSEIDFIHGSTREEYQNKLAVSASVEAGFGAFSGSIKSSFSQNFENTTEYSFSNLTYSSTLCILDLRSDAHQEYLLPSFSESIAKLPDNLGDLQPFSRFFEQYGTYFIWQVTYGGRLSISTAVNKSTLLTEKDISVAAQAQYASIFKAGVKVDDSDKYKKFAQNSSTLIKASGGNQTLTTAFVGQPPEPSNETKRCFTDWVASIPLDAAPILFKLKGIWELCGSKRDLVYQAWNEYGAQMHPRLTAVAAQTGEAPPIITLNRQLKPTNTFQPSKYGGWEVIVLDRFDVLSEKAVKLNKTYPLHFSRDIYETYDQIWNDIIQSGYANEKHLLLVVTFGIQRNLGPMGNFFELLYTTGGSTQNLNQIKPWNVGSVNGDYVWYFLIGAFNSGVSAGVDFAGGEWQKSPVLEYNVAFYRDRHNGPYAFSLVSAKVSNET
jgi:hypothetical protein